MKKHERSIQYVTQKASDFSVPRFGTVYREWQYSLDRRDRLPRGKWFKNQKAGKPYVVMDEAHLFKLKP